MSRTAADLLPNVTFNDIDDHDLVLDAVILLRVSSTTGDGKPRLIIQTTPDLDWILLVGMLNAALHIETHDIQRDTDDEDDE